MMLIEIARFQGDDMALMMLMRMEAMTLGHLCDDMAKLECIACRGDKNVPHLCNINHGTKIEIFHEQARKILPRGQIVERWESIIALMQPRPTLVALLNILADPILQTATWSEYTKNLSLSTTIY